LANLKVSKTVSPDGFSAYIIKLFSSSLASKISHFFEIMFSHSYFPPECSKAIVTPVYKKGSRQFLANYRHIVNTSTLCKQMEHIIKDKMMDYLNNNHLAVMP